jgi:hypothetical protein
MAYHYGAPPAHYTKFYDPESPYSSNEYVYHAAYDQTPKRSGHVRRTSYSPREGGYYSPAGGSPPWYESQDYATPRKNVYVSTDNDGTRRRYDFANTKYHTRTKSQQTQPIYRNDGAGYYTEPRVINRTPTKRAPKAAADEYVYHQQEKVYSEAPRRTSTKTRRASTTSKPTHKSKPSYTAPVATDDDAARAGIPPGYSIKNWDPTELPIILLGSVFDANSLGKWIYDWTVFRYTASHPFADVAGEMWLLLIKLAGKMKRADECLPRIRSADSRELITDFLESADRLWDKFKTLLKECEYYMLKAAKREGSKKMGRNAGTEFVDSMFNKNRYLDSTERLMQSMRTWNHRFDANCEEILRRPSQA